MSWKNVNNWHWEERDCVDWVKKYIEENFKPLALAADKVKITNLTGDAVVSQRKNKLIAVYDIQAAFKFTEITTEYEAKVELCSESSDNDFELSLRPNDPKLRSAILSYCSEFNKKMLNDILDFHKAYFSESVLLNRQQPSVESSHVAVNIGVDSRNLVNISDDFALPISAEQALKLLLDDDLVLKWSQGSFTKSGDVKAIYDNLILYRILSHDNQNIKMEWKVKNWDSFGSLKISISNDESGCKLSTQLEGVPPNFADDHAPFFERYYWGPIKRLFGIF